MKENIGIVEQKPLTCSTCKYKGFSFIGLPRCHHPNLGIDLVTGKTEESFCANQREFSIARNCGPAGKFHSSIFPAKEQP